MRRSVTPPDLRGLCPRCWLVEPRCLCAHVPRLEVRTRVIVLRHAKEAWRTSNTGRLLALAVPRVELVEWGGAEPLGALELGARAAVLYPGGAREPPAGLDTLVLLDGSWGQAKSMNRRVGALAGLPRWSLSPGGMRPARLRRAPRPGALSTLEAAAEALTVLEGPAVGQALYALFDVRVDSRDFSRRAVDALPARGP